MNQLKLSRSALVAWTLCALVLVFGVLTAATALNTPDTHSNALQVVGLVLGALAILAFAVVGALIISRQPRNTIGWLLMLIAFPNTLFQLIPAQNIIEQTLASGGPPTLLNWLLLWLKGWSWWFLIGPLLLIPVLFPNGRPPSPRWRWVIVALGITFLVFLSIATLDAQISDVDSGLAMPNPIGVIPPDVINEIFGLPWTILLGGITIACVSAIFARYRRADFSTRQQIKWLLYACAFFLVVYLIGGVTQGELGDIFNVGFSLALLGIPVAIGIAILRYRLFDIDVIIRRTLTYALVTASLVIVFFGSVILLQQLFSGITGSGQNEIVTVLSTLAIAALFVPVRSRIQTEIDKRFNRNKYDAQQVLNDFATTVRDETDLEKLAARLMQVVDQTMQPKSVSMWLKKEGRRLKDER